MSELTPPRLLPLTKDTTPEEAEEWVQYIFGALRGRALEFDEEAIRQDVARQIRRLQVHELVETVIEDDLTTVTLVCACRGGWSTIKGWNEHLAARDV